MHDYKTELTKCMIHHSVKSPVGKCKDVVGVLEEIVEVGGGKEAFNIDVV